jgi:hypothetical protein
MGIARVSLFAMSALGYVQDEDRRHQELHFVHHRHH